ncbi:MAG: amidohydrolase family protein [Micropepsaceae bacterium]
MLDLKITGGTVVNGSGGTPFTADIAVKDGRIVSVGKSSEHATRTIDAAGAIVTPGFVDIHTHYDGQAVWDREMAPSSCNGVTSVMMGNCGVGFAPLRPGQADRLVKLMEGVEEIPGTVLYEGLDWKWETFADYLNRLASTPRSINVASQVPHDPVRLYVMGDRAATQQPATPDDVEQMKSIVRDALHAGAFGFSTGRSDTHRTSDGRDTPAAVAEEYELTSIAGVLRDLPYRILSAVNDFDTFKGPAKFDAEFDLMEKMARAAGRPMTLTTLERLGDAEQWQRVASRVERARASGLDMRMQVAPRGVGVLNGLRTTLNIFIAKPSYRAIRHLPHDQLVTELRKPEVRQKILSEPFIKVSEIDKSAPPQIDQAVAALDFVAARLYELGDPPNYEPRDEDSVAAKARARGVSAQEEIYDTMLKFNGEGLLYFPIFNYMSGNLDTIAKMIAHPAAHMGLGDGGAHVGTISDAAWTTFFLQHWTTRKEGSISLARAIQMLTSVSSDFMGLKDRGRIAEGQAADINVIDQSKLRLHRPYIAYDLPAGGRRLLQKAEGYVATLVAGQPIIENDQPTHATPGTLLRAI